MDDTGKQATSRVGRSTVDRAGGNGQASQNGAPRPKQTAVLDKTAPIGDDTDDRSLARRSFDELMESRRGESRAVWRAFLGPLLSQTEVQELIGAGSAQEVDALVEEQRLLALPTHEGDVVYPAFQFRADGRPYPVIRRVIEILGPVVAVTPYTIASWLMSPKPYFRGASPMHWLEMGRDPRRVVAEARLAAAHMAR